MYEPEYGNEWRAGIEVERARGDQMRDNLATPIRSDDEDRA